VLLFLNLEDKAETQVSSWFPDGFHGTMGELLCAIKEKRRPQNNTEDNLKSLQLCFSACISADIGKPVDPESAGKWRK